MGFTTIFFFTLFSEFYLLIADVTPTQPGLKYPSGKAAVFCP
jgi:hypothetical protein